MKALSSEFRLLTAACGWPPGKARDERVRRLAADVRWDLVLALTDRHRVDGLVWAALVAARVDLPVATADQLQARARAVARASLASAAESVALQQILAEAGAPALVMKGSAVEVLAYGRLGLKSAWDIDLLVAPADVDLALSILCARGYRLVEPSGLSARQFATWIELAKECELRNDGNGRVVELHWRLTDGPSLLPGLGADASTQTVSVSPGSKVTTFARDELFSYLCVHGAMHGWSRLKWLADLAALLSQESLSGLEQLWRRSRELGAGRCPAQALLLCRDLFGLELPPGLEARLRASPVNRWLVDVAMRTLAGGGAAELDARPWASPRILVAQLALGGGWSHAWQEFRHRATSLHDRVHLPLPPGLSFLYPILRVPLWLGRRLRGRFGHQT